VLKRELNSRLNLNGLSISNSQHVSQTSTDIIMNKCVYLASCTKLQMQIKLYSAGFAFASCSADKIRRSMLTSSNMTNAIYQKGKRSRVNHVFMIYTLNNQCHIYLDVLRYFVVDSDVASSYR
jgi:hypothetical protein